MVRDRIEPALLVSELSRDFCKPLTVEALARFDPDLYLLFNKKRDIFNVHRLVWKTARYWLGPDEGWLSYTYPTLHYVMDWKEGLLGSDNPAPLLRTLYESDTRRVDVLKRLDEMQARYLERTRKTVDENWRHAHLDNRRLIERAWEPVLNSPFYVR